MRPTYGKHFKSFGYTLSAMQVLKISDRIDHTNDKKCSIFVLHVKVILLKFFL